MIDILEAYGIPPKIVIAIAIMYVNTTASVIPPERETSYFEILAGVLQGDTLAQFIFIITFDYVIRTATEQHESLGFTIKERTS